MIGPAVQVMGKSAFLIAGGVTLLIGALEAGALAAVLHGLGVAVTPALGLVVVGAASLSTFLPSAPAYIGTYQYAFILALQQFALDGALGVAAATLVQLVLFGPVVLGGYAVVAALFWFLFGYASYRGRDFRLSRTLWRGIRFDQKGNAWAYATRQFLWSLLVVAAR